MMRRPQLNWPYITIIVVIAFLGLGFIAVSVVLRPFGDLSPAGNAWAQLFIGAGCLGMFLGLLNKVRCDSQVVLDDDYVSRPTLFGVQTLRWSEVREVRTYGYGIHLHGANTRIVLAPFAYADPYGFIWEIRRRTHHLAS